jgi:membrane-bound inhibitor of C-type lysozyme
MRRILATLLLSCSLSVAAQAATAVRPKQDSYRCAHAIHIIAKYSLDFQAAVITASRLGKQGLLHRKTWRVKKAPAASGVRYVGHGVEWWTKGSTANLYALTSEQVLAKSCVLR